MMSEFIELFSFPFVQRALIAGSLISITAAMLGVILVLKHYSLIGHGLSEIGFASLSIAAALNVPAMMTAVPAVITAAFAIMFISQKYRTAGDIAIALASCAALALGVIVSSLSGKSSNMSGYLFGSVLAITQGDLLLSAGTAITVIAAFAVFYNRLFLITYNEDYARTLGINVTLYQFLISLMTALIIVTGMRITGTLLISGVIILPAVTARSLARSFRSLVVMAALISLGAFVSGLAVSFMLNLPAGASVILSNTIMLVLVKILT